MRRTIRDIPQHTKDLYFHLKNKKWDFEIHVLGIAKGTVDLTITCKEDERRTIEQEFAMLGFVKHSYTFPSSEILGRVDLQGHYSDPATLAIHLMILKDQDENPLLLITKNYKLPTWNVVFVGSDY